MEQLKKMIFALGLAAFLMALLSAGSLTGQIFWQAGIAIIAVDIAIILLWPARPDWTRPGHCVHCGYDLTGNTSDRCPECDKEIVWRTPPRSAPQATTIDEPTQTTSQ